MNDKKRILHVDDEPDILETVKTILENEGFEVVSAISGKEALKQIKSNNFDLFILDVMMPDISGWDLFIQIKKLKSDYKVIILSIIEVSQSRLKELRAHGISDYIMKPFHRDDFVKRIKKIILN